MLYSPQSSQTEFPERRAAYHHKQKYRHWAMTGGALPSAQLRSSMVDVIERILISSNLLEYYVLVEMS